MNQSQFRIKVECDASVISQCLCTSSVDACMFGLKLKSVLFWSKNYITLYLYSQIFIHGMC